MEKIKKKLQKLQSQFELNSEKCLGYPANAKFNYQDLDSFLNYCGNNIGDPYINGRYHVNTKEFEQEVLDFFYEILGTDNKHSWGYVTNGGTEGNLYGLFIAREKFPDGILYYSDQTHYSVKKIVKLLNLKAIEIESLPNGEIDYEKLKSHVSFRSHTPAILFANIGTTMKGAIDDIDKMQAVCKNIPYYIHADEALFGMTLPFLDTRQSFKIKDGIDSIAISGHKFIGSPFPSGIVICKKEYIDPIKSEISYIQGNDATISGSRSAFNPLILWYAIQTKKISGFQEMAERCIKTADYAIQEFKKRNVDAWRNENSNIVVFPESAMTEKSLNKYQIACASGIGHIVCMADTKEKTIDDFLKEGLIVNSN